MGVLGIKINMNANELKMNIIHGPQVSSKFFMIYIWTSILLISTWSSYHVWRSWRGFRNRSWPSRPPHNIQRMASGFFQYKLCPSFSPISQSPGLLNFSCLFGHPQKVDFTSRYQKKECVVFNELDEYFKLPWEDFDTCEPLNWWQGRHSQFPRLYRLVTDIFSIPGKLYMIILHYNVSNMFQARFSCCHWEDFFWRMRHNIFTTC